MAPLLRTLLVLAVTALACDGSTRDPDPAALDPPSMQARAAEIVRLQRGRTSDADEARIVGLFLETAGLQLTELKERVDAGGDYRDLQQLVYRDIDDEGLRRRLIDHLRREAQAVRDEHGAQGIKVVSDIDDTLYPNFGDRRRWGMGAAFYPGVVQFYEALTGDAPPGRARITLVSARPEDRLGLLEAQSGEGLRTRGLPPHTILSGTAWTLASIAPGAVGQRAVAEIGAEKLADFVAWSALMAEFDFIISGDRTQADHVFAAEALALEGGAVLAGFIHDVGEAPVREAPHLYYNTTVLGHAVDAFTGGWIDRRGLRRVRDAVRRGRDEGLYPPELDAAVEDDLTRAAERLGEG